MINVLLQVLGRVVGRRADSWVGKSEEVRAAAEACQTELWSNIMP